MADGKFGLSVDDVVYRYPGNRENIKLAAKLPGSMKDKADHHERSEIVKWVRANQGLKEFTRLTLRICAIIPRCTQPSWKGNFRR